jgi:hypothetical protein
MNYPRIEMSSIYFLLLGQETRDTNTKGIPVSPEHVQCGESTPDRGNLSLGSLPDQKYIIALTIETKNTSSYSGSLRGAAGNGLQSIYCTPNENRIGSPDKVDM